VGAAERRRIFSFGESRRGRADKDLAALRPFFLAGAIAATFGIDPIASYRLLVCGCGGVVRATIGQQLEITTVLRTLIVALCLLMALSAAMTIAVPTIGTQPYGAREVWRGLFVHKNQLVGWPA